MIVNSGGFLICIPTVEGWSHIPAVPTHSLASQFGTKQAHSRRNKAASPQEICAYRAPVLEQQHESKKQTLFHSMDKGDVQPITQKSTTLIQQFAPKVVQTRVHNCPLSHVFFSTFIVVVLFHFSKKNFLKFYFNLL